MKKTLSSIHKIRFQDCDPFNHLNNAKYIDYFINAREEQVEKDYGLNIYQHAQETGKAWVVGSNQIAYLKAAKTVEEVLIESTLINKSDKMLHVEMQMFDKEKTHLKALYWTQFFYVDLKSQKLSQHSNDLMQLFAKAELPVNEKIFENRLKVIRN